MSTRPKRPSTSRVLRIDAAALRGGCASRSLPPRRPGAAPAAASPARSAMPASRHDGLASADGLYLNWLDRAVGAGRGFLSLRERRLDQGPSDSAGSRLLGRRHPAGAGRTRASSAIWWNRWARTTGPRAARSARWPISTRAAWTSAPSMRRDSRRCSRNSRASAAIGNARRSCRPEFAHLQSIGVGAPLQIGQMQDFKDSTRVIAVASQSGLGLPNRDYYLKSEPTFTAARAAYVAARGADVRRCWATRRRAPRAKSKAVMALGDAARAALDVRRRAARSARDLSSR